MNPTSKLFEYCGAAMLAAGIVMCAPLAMAQDAGMQTPDPQIEATAQKLFKAIADQDVKTVQSLTAKRFQKKLAAQDLRPLPTGPKLNVAYDGKVEIRRFSAKDAVVSAAFFAPTSTDLPKTEGSRLDIYLVKEKAGWVAYPPDKKEAGTDASMAGGWFHNGAFTFCPNDGIDYIGGHFSTVEKCAATAVCRSVP
ncbi:MAG TPA: hypothetical protein VEC38_15550 [Candidatus Binataceae bacterium]|nr:hypothetical protein [Candidatus Binataceae bacterium]